VDTVRNLMAPQNAPKIHHLLPLLADAVSEDLLQLLTAVLGPKRRYAAAQQLGRFLIRADIGRFHEYEPSVTQINRLADELKFGPKFKLTSINARKP
jgi:hypothetical protein